MQAHEGELAVAFAGFDGGAAIPSVDAAVIKRLSETASGTSLAKPNMATGLGAYAACGLDVRSLGPQQLIAVVMRQNLLSALIQRGVVSEYMQDEKSRERVYLAAATIPCSKDDIAESFVQLQLSLETSERAEQAKKEMKQLGYDPDNPRIDRRFVAWMQENC